MGWGSNEVARGEQSIGGGATLQGGRLLAVPASWLSNNEQAHPIRVVHGTDRFAGIQISPVFNLVATEITQETGGK